MIIYYHVAVVLVWLNTVVKHLHRHDGLGGGQILENWGQAELKLK
jgi:hypothetical protein